MHWQTTCRWVGGLLAGWVAGRLAGSLVASALPPAAVNCAGLAAHQWGPDSAEAVPRPACLLPIITHTRPCPWLLPLPLPLPLLPQVPLDRADCQLRANEVGALRQWASAPSEALRRDGSPILSPEYMARVVPRLTSGELCGLYPWERLAAGGSSGRCPWYYPGLLKVGWGTRAGWPGWPG